MLGYPNPAHPIQTIHVIQVTQGTSLMTLPKRVKAQLVVQQVKTAAPQARVWTPFVITWTTPLINGM